MRNLFLTILLILVSFKASSQETKPEPKIGLVLSGGGAKGFAHIGALKVIDSLGVKVDYVAGTSMGAIVGSLYASGYSGKQIDSIFNSVDFNDVIGDNLPRASKTLYERDQNERYAVVLPLNGFKVSLPSGLSRGQNVFNLFTKLTHHVSNVKDFSKLPIPFFCIATNVENGKEIVLDSGNLAQAVRASGAFPSLFQPVEIDGKLLVDGGVVNNYPIDKLRAKGVDIIIGVDVQDGLMTREELKSAPDILMQINNYRTIEDMVVKSKKTDIYIKPDIKGFSVISFDDLQEIVKRGTNAAIKQANYLKDVASSQTKTLKQQQLIQPLDSIRFKKVEFSGHEKYTKSYLLGKLKIKDQEAINYNEFIKGVNNLIATNNFDAFDYTIQNNNDGTHNLIAQVKESKQTTFLKLGVHYDNLYRTALLANITQKRMLFKNDVVSLDLILGENSRYNFEYFIDKGYHWSIGLNSRFNQFDSSIAANLLLSEEELTNFNVNKLDVDVKDWTNQFFLQTLLQKNLSLRLGVEHKKLKVVSETIILDDLEGQTLFENGNFFSLFGKLQLDSFTNKYYPKSGFLVDADFHLYFSASQFNQDFQKFSIAKANLAYVFKIGPKIATKIGSEGGFKIGKNNIQSLNFSLGGYGNDFINNNMSFYGYNFKSLAGNSFVKGYLDVDYEIFKKHHIVASANFANIDNNIFKSGNWLKAPDFSGYALGYGLETFLGPIEAKWTYSPEIKKNIWFFNIGFWF